MGTPTQVTGTASESNSLGQTNGFIGWSPQEDRTVGTLLGGSTFKGVYANSTAYAVGDVVSYNGDTYTALTAIGAGNVTPPAVGSNWRLSGNKRGPAQISAPNVRALSFFR